MTPQEYIKIANDTIAKAVKAVFKRKLAGIALAAAIVAAVAAATAFVKKTYLPQVTAPGTPEQTQNINPPSQPRDVPVLVVKLDKTDPNWKKKYCNEEVVKLPTAPFAYDKHMGPAFSLPSTYIYKLIPEEKKYNNAYACTMEYKYENEEKAFASLGVKYKFDSERFNDFYEQIDILFTKAVNGEWKKISPFDRKETGTPFYMYDGLPAIFQRENERADTVEYAEAYKLPKSLLVKFTFYEK